MINKLNTLINKLSYNGYIIEKLRYYATGEQPCVYVKVSHKCFNITDNQLYITFTDGYIENFEKYASVLNITNRFTLEELYKYTDEPTGIEIIIQGGEVYANFD